MKTLFYKSVENIPISILKDNFIRCVLLDVDNTIRPYKGKELCKGSVQWIKQVKKEGIKIILCSNNFKKTLAPFAKELGVDYISFCLKPSPILLFKAKMRTKLKRKNMVIIGDQLFTDILSSKIGRFHSILVDPVEDESYGITVKIRRALLKPIENKIKKNSRVNGRNF